MPENQTIEHHIAAILKGSGLPMDRREEIAEELRGHFEQLVAAKLDHGHTEEQAIQSALADFGSPALIRRQLRRHQRIVDRRYALAEVRRLIWLPVFFSGFFATLFAVFCPDTDSLFKRFLGGVCLFACFS